MVFINEYIRFSSTYWKTKSVSILLGTIVLLLIIEDSVLALRVSLMMFSMEVSMAMILRHRLISVEEIKQMGIAEFTQNMNKIFGAVILTRGLIIGVILLVVLT